MNLTDSCSDADGRGGRGRAAWASVGLALRRSWCEAQEQWLQRRVGSIWRGAGRKGGALYAVCV